MLSGIDYEDLFNLPYGIDVNPKDGGVWYAKLWADKIGHVDPKTLEITEYDTPAQGAAATSLRCGRHPLDSFVR